MSFRGVNRLAAGNTAPGCISGYCRSDFSHPSCHSSSSSSSPPSLILFFSSSSLFVFFMIFFTLIPPLIFILFFILFLLLLLVTVALPWCYCAWSWEFPSDRNILPCLHWGVFILRGYPLIVTVILTIIIPSACLLVIVSISKLSRRSELSSGTPCKIVTNHDTIHSFFFTGSNEPTNDQ